MRSLEESRERWRKTRSYTRQTLRQNVRRGDDSPCQAGLRSICWRICFLFDEESSETWLERTSTSREAYVALRARFSSEQADNATVDPLNDGPESPWSILRKDEELRAELRQDIERCMPELDYFRQADAQRMMLDILFVYCKINGDVGYRQGMHELLAPILWTIQSDSIDHAGIEHVEQTEDDAVMLGLSDSRYVEHDAFTVFSVLMGSAKAFYELGETGMAPPIIERSQSIHEVYLAEVDPELAKHLTNIEILPQIFLMRWIRLLFGREFEFERLLEFWDALFAEDPDLQLVDYICIAMLLRIRWQVLDADYSSALMLLMKHDVSEANGDLKVSSYVDDAMQLRDDLSPECGRRIIETRTGRRPQPIVSSPSTPQRMTSPQRLSLAKSPLSSPARFIQQQGGVEALLQGAAKNVLERGERLGINQALRDAVGEVKKNMQGLQTPRPGSARRADEQSRWSLDQGRQVPSYKASLHATQSRNQKLADMLGGAMSDLRTVTSSLAGAEKADEAAKLDGVISKVDFIRFCLEDPTISVGSLDEQPGLVIQQSQMASTSKDAVLNSQTTNTSERQEVERAWTANHVNEAGRTTDAKSHTNTKSDASKAHARTDSASSANDAIRPDTDKLGGLGIRPSAPIPTRSSIAQSSFAWMLDDASISPKQYSSPPKHTSTFRDSGKRGSNAGKERSAYLFGDEKDDGRETTGSPGKARATDDVDEVFRMLTIRGGKGVTVQPVPTTEPDGKEP